MAIDRKKAEELIIDSYIQLADPLRRLYSMVPKNKNYPAGSDQNNVIIAYMNYCNSLGIEDIGSNIKEKVKKHFLSDLRASTDNTIIETIIECREMAKKYNLPIYDKIAKGEITIKYVETDGKVLNDAALFNLMDVKDKTRIAPMYRQGGGGRFPKTGGTDADSTFCNQAIFDIAEATGFNRTALYNGASRDKTNANQAARNLASAASQGLIDTVTPERARELAKLGYTVIAAREETDENPKTKMPYPGHIATVSPLPMRTKNLPSSNANDTMISNVGRAVFQGVVTAEKAFAGKTPIYYYDPNQNFAAYDSSGIAKVKE